MNRVMNRAALILIFVFLTGCGREESTMENWEDVPAQIEIEDEEGSMEDAVVQYPLIATPSDAKWIHFVLVSEESYCIFDGEKYGFIAENGEEIAPCIYDIAYPFNERLACVCKDGKYGYIDSEGETALPFDYDRATPFVEGLAYFAIGDTYGFMDKSGEPVFHFECDSVSSFQEGLAYFSIDGRYGYIDQRGQIAIEPIFDDAGYFKEGLAKVMKDGRYGMISRDGAFIIAAEYDSITIDGSFIIAQSGGKYTCFDREGKELLGQSDYIYAPTGGEYAYFEKEGKSGLIDKKGDILIESMYDRMLLPMPGQNFLIVREDELYGIVDLQGEVRIPIIYDYIDYDGYADTASGGMFLLTDADGNKESVDAADFSEKIPCNYDSIDWLSKDRAIVTLDGLSGMIDGEGNLVEPIEYDSIFLKGNCYQIEKEGKYGFLNEQGEVVVSPIYDYISEYFRVWGASANIYIATNDSSDIRNSVIKTGEPVETDISETLLQNEITPRIGLYQEFTRSGSVSVEDATVDGHTATQEDLRGYKKTYKLYDLNHTGEPILYFEAEPYENCNFPMSYSGFYTICDNQLVEMLTGYECGGSLRGDYVCLWYDRETSRVLPGTNGVVGGFGGYSYYGAVYDTKDGEMLKIASFGNLIQQISYFSSEELEHAELVYDSDNKPYTKETIALAEQEKSTAQTYSVNGVQTTIEEYRKMEDRYLMIHLY